MLDTLTSFAMHSRQPVSVWGGKDLNVIYNKPYSEVSTAAHWHDSDEGESFADDS